MRLNAAGARYMPTVFAILEDKKEAFLTLLGVNPRKARDGCLNLLAQHRRIRRQGRHAKPCLTGEGEYGFVVVHGSGAQKHDIPFC